MYSWKVKYFPVTKRQLQTQFGRNAAITSHFINNGLWNCLLTHVWSWMSFGLFIVWVCSRFIHPGLVSKHTCKKYNSHTSRSLNWKLTTINMIQALIYWFEVSFADYECVYSECILAERSKMLFVARFVDSLILDMKHILIRIFLEKVHTRRVTARIRRPL